MELDENIKPHVKAFVDAQIQNEVTIIMKNYYMENRDVSDEQIKKDLLLGNELEEYLQDKYY